MTGFSFKRTAESIFIFIVWLVAFFLACWEATTHSAVGWNASLLLGPPLLALPKSFAKVVALDLLGFPTLEQIAAVLLAIDLTHYVETGMISFSMEAEGHLLLTWEL